MTQAELQEATSVETEEQRVLEFLTQTPDFFERHPELLAELPLQHGSGSAVSLIERQVKVLRDKNASLSERLDSLLSTAYENEARVNGMSRLAENLISAGSLDQVVASLRNTLQTDFSVEEVKLALFSGLSAADDAAHISLDKAKLPKELSNFFRQGHIYCGEISAELRAALFAEHTELKSVAMVPLDRHDCMGLLALASTEPTRFRPDMGKLFLEITANLCAAALRFHGAGKS